MTRFEREIEGQRARRIRADAAAAGRIAHRFQRVRGRLRDRTRQLLDRIAERRGRGLPVGESWMHADEAFRELIADTSGEAIRFLADALDEVRRAQGVALGRTEGDVRRLAELALGPSPGNRPAPLPRWLALELVKLRPDTAARIVGAASDGRPLGLLFAELAPQHTQRITDILAAGVRSGRATDLIAADIADASGMTLTRAMTIARQETARAYRDASMSILREPESPVEEWVWVAQSDACGSCQAQHGSVHPIDEDLESHILCRCVAAPRMPSWQALGFTGIPDLRPRIQTGAERFASFDPAVQLSILGPGKYEAYRTGRITLDDLVTRTHSERWGPGSREATLAEALA